MWGCTLGPPANTTAVAMRPVVKLLCPLVIVRPHSSTTYVDAAYCFGRYVCLSVCYSSEPCINGRTDRDAVRVEDLGWLKEPCIRWGPDPPCEGAILGERGARCKV